LTLDEALPKLLASAQVLPQIESVSTFDADGRVLAQDVVSALQVPPQDNKAFKKFLGELGYPSVEETHNPVYRLFLQK